MTHDITIPDLTNNEAILLLVGLSYVMMHAADHQSKERIVQAGELQEQIRLANTDVYRQAFLAGDIPEHVHVDALPETVLDALDVELIDGELYDADAMTDIDVE